MTSSRATAEVKESGVRSASSAQRRIVKTRRHPSGASQADEVYHALKWRILTMDIPPGTLLTEQDICELLEYGRAPVHQALHRLKYDGLVEILPRKGIVVRAFSPRDINNVIETRLPVEMEMVRLAAIRATPERIERLRALLASGRELLARNDRESLMTLDRSFHRGIAECTENPVLTDVLENLHQRSLMLWLASIASDGREYHVVQEEHEQILDRIAARDPDGAARAVRLHLEPFLRR
jgi:DNA-binding GntR family transcriptional regulator